MSKARTLSLRARRRCGFLDHVASTEPCSVIIGTRGSGKSEGLKRDLLLLALSGQMAVLCVDRPGTLARQMVGHLSANGLEKRTLIEIASDTDCFLRWPFIRNSTAGGLKAEVENELEDERFSQVFYSNRHLKSGTDKPYTKKFLDAAIAIFRSQVNPLPIHRILDCFKFGSKEFEDILDGAQDKDAAWIFLNAEARGRRNPIQLEIEAGSAQRMLSILKSPVIRLRNGEGLDWESIIDQKLQVYFDLSGVTTEIARFLSIMASHAAINVCRSHFDRTGKPLPLVIVLEEAGAMDLVTPFILDSMRELRKCGVSVWVVSQTVRDFDEDTFESLLALSGRHLWYRIDSGLERAAKDLSDPTFDAMEVHYKRERIVNDGVQKVVTKTTSTSKDHLGRKRKDDRENIHFLPVQRSVVEEYYKSPQLHEQEFRTALATLKVGQRFVRENGVRKETVKMLGEAWPLGLSEIRTQKAIVRIRSSYQTSSVSLSAAERLSGG